MAKSSVSSFLLFIITFIIININNVISTSYFEYESKLSPCSYFESINITNGIKLKDGSILHDYVKYPKSSYNYYDYIYPTMSTKVKVKQYIRGCVCHFKTCVRLCCENPGEFYHREHRGCRKDDNDFIISITKGDNISHHKIYDTDLAVVHGKPCDGFYTKPDKGTPDEWYFLPNGKIYMNFTNSSYDISTYCLSYVYSNKSVPATLQAHICFESEEEIPKLLTPIGMLLSVPFLLATFLVYALLKELRASLHGKSLMCYIIGLTVGYTLLSTLILLGEKRPSFYICHSLAYLTYFSFMLSFFWLNVISFDIWWTFGRGGNHDRRRFLKYSVYAWGCSLTVLLLCFLMQNLQSTESIYSPGIGRQSCWLHKETTSEFIYFYLPVLLIITSNIIFFAMTAHKLRLSQKQTAKTLTRADSRKHSNFETEKDKFSLYFRLFIIMGITWSMEVISWAVSSNEWIFYLTDTCNCFQGILIFLLFVWKPRVRTLLAERFKCDFCYNHLLWRTTKTTSGTQMWKTKTITENRELQVIQQESPFIGETRELETGIKNKTIEDN